MPCHVTPCHATLGHVLISPSPLLNIHSRSCPAVPHLVSLCQTSTAYQALQCHIMSRHVTLHSVRHSFDPALCQTSMINQFLQCYVMSRHVTSHLVLNSFYPPPFQSFKANKLSCHAMSRLTWPCILFISSP